MVSHRQEKLKLEKRVEELEELSQDLKNQLEGFRGEAEKMLSAVGRILRLNDSQFSGSSITDQIENLVSKKPIKGNKDALNCPQTLQTLQISQNL